MIRINLLPVREVEQASSRRKETALAGGLIALTCAGVAIAYVLQGSQLSEVNAELRRAEKALEKIRLQNQDLEKIEEKKKDTEEKLRLVRVLTSPQRRAASVHVLDDLSTSTPESLWLTDFIETKGAAKISGKAVDNQTIAAFAHNLSNSVYFQNVEIRETVQEVQTVNEPRRRAARAEATVDNAAAFAPPVTKFLIEARINYTPGVQGEIGQVNDGQEGEDGKGSPARKGKK
jgi:Tfp pilus assembly protein PilN